MTDVATTLLGVESFARPGLGLLALALGLGLWLRGLRRPAAAVSWPAWPELAAAGGRRRDLLRGLGAALRGLAIVALAGVVAGPVAVRRTPPPPGLGLDLVLVLDTSGSMRALDAQSGGEWRTRLALAREAVGRFAQKRVEDGDRVGLVVFGETAHTQLPLSSDARLLAAALARVEAGMAGEATALGEALALGVKRALGPQARAESAGTAASAPVPVAAPVEGRVVVLLTDGRSNAGEIPTDVAAGLARTLGVRVHTVGVGGEGPVPMAAAPGAPRSGLRFERHDLDAATLQAIAAGTGGRFYLARRAQDLEEVYAEIDRLERVPRRPPPTLRRTPRDAPLLAVAGAALALELLLLRVLWRRLP